MYVPLQVAVGVPLYREAQCQAVCDAMEAAGSLFHPATAAHFDC